jgi:hypothetical protein
MVITGSMITGNASALTDRNSGGWLMEPDAIVVISGNTVSGN